MPDPAAKAPTGLPSAATTTPFSVAAFAVSPVQSVPAGTDGTVIAFDFGSERIGIAVGETASNTAHPLTTVAGANIEARFEAIGRVIAEWKPVRLLVGLPLHIDGTEHEMTARARRFARRLEGRFALPVEMVDERLSTRAAAALLSAAGVDARRQRPVRDQVAAQTILQSWLDGRSGDER